MAAVETTDRQTGLVRSVGFWGLVAFCINAVVGSGVFLLPSESFKILGPFSLWAPLLFSVPVFILVLCFAEAASHFTRPGGAYLYARTAFGDFVGFETGWMNWLARVTSLAALSNGLVVTLARYYPGVGTGMPRAILITGVLLALAVIHALGVKYGAGTIYVFTIGKLFPLIAFIVVALFLFPTNPFPASMHLPVGPTDWSEAALLLLFAYAGFENLGVPAGEYKNPRKDLPLALLAGIIAIAAMYSLSQVAALSAIPNLSSTDTPVVDAARALVGPIGAAAVTLGAILSMIGTNSGTMLEGSRMLYSLALDRRRFGWLRAVHPTFRTPLFAIIVHTVVAIPLALGGTFAKLAVLSAVARITTYLVTSAAIPFLRKLGGGFRTPLIVPILGVVVSLTLVLTLKPKHLIAAAIALAVGAVLFAIAGQSDRASEVEPEGELAS